MSSWTGALRLGRRLLAGMAMLAGLSAPAQAEAPPVEAFFGSAAIRGMELSPSGRWLATIAAPPGSRKRLIVMNLESREPPQVVAFFDKYDVASAQWIDDDWLVFSVSDHEDQSGKGKGNGLLAVRRDGKNLRLLIKREWDTEFPARGAGPLEANFEMIGRGAPGSRQIVVGEYHYDNNSWDLDHVTLHSLDITDGSRKVLLKDGPPHRRVQGWWLDAQGRARLARASQDGQSLYFWADAKTGAWKEIGRFPAHKPRFTPLFIDDQERLMVTARNEQTGFDELREFELATLTLGNQPVVSTPGFDAQPWRTRDPRGRTLGYHVLTDGVKSVWLTPELQAIQARVDAALPGRINRLACGDCESLDSILVYSYSDRQPLEYLHLRPRTGQWERFGQARPAIQAQQMGSTELLRTRARDGLELPVWITRPAGATDKALPAVVLVHGGPWLRGRELEWEAEAQFLASRGYLVIEPEFRGSEGFGLAHFLAGWKQWGQAMQDDVADALKFAVDKGWADAGRVCIAGASYGGYATLMGLVRHGELYRCGVAWVGVTHPRYMFDVHWSDIGRDAKLNSLPEMIGDPQADAAMLAANAPVEQAAKIRRPVLLAYGARDMRVPIVHGEAMRAALTKAGNPPEWIVYNDEGHGWSRPQNRVDFWTRVEAFLARHLKQP